MNLARTVVQLVGRGCLVVYIHIVLYVHFAATEMFIKRLDYDYDHVFSACPNEEATFSVMTKQTHPRVPFVVCLFFRQYTIGGRSVSMFVFSRWWLGSNDESMLVVGIYISLLPSPVSFVQQATV